MSIKYKRISKRSNEINKEQKAMSQLFNSQLTKNEDNLITNHYKNFAFVDLQRQFEHDFPIPNELKTKYRENLIETLEENEIKSFFQRGNFLINTQLRLTNLLFLLYYHYNCGLTIIINKEQEKNFKGFRPGFHIETKDDSPKNSEKEDLKILDSFQNDMENPFLDNEIPIKKLENPFLKSESEMNNPFSFYLTEDPKYEIKNSNKPFNSLLFGQESDQKFSMEKNKFFKSDLIFKDYDANKDLFKTNNPTPPTIENCGGLFDCFKDIKTTNINKQIILVKQNVCSFFYLGIIKEESDTSTPVKNQKSNKEKFEDFDNSDNENSSSDSNCPNNTPIKNEIEEAQNVNTSSSKKSKKNKNKKKSKSKEENKPNSDKNRKSSKTKQTETSEIKNNLSLDSVPVIEGTNIKQDKDFYYLWNNIEKEINDTFNGKFDYFAYLDLIGLKRDKLLLDYTLARDFNFDKINENLITYLIKKAEKYQQYDIPLPKIPDKLEQVLGYLNQIQYIIKLLKETEDIDINRFDLFKKYSYYNKDINAFPIINSVLKRCGLSEIKQWTLDPENIFNLADFERNSLKEKIKRLKKEVREKNATIKQLIKQIEEMSVLKDQEIDHLNNELNNNLNVLNDYEQTKIELLNAKCMIRRIKSTDLCNNFIDYFSHLLGNDNNMEEDLKIKAIVKKVKEKLSALNYEFSIEKTLSALKRFKDYYSQYAHYDYDNDKFEIDLFAKDVSDFMENEFMFKGANNNFSYSNEINAIINKFDELKNYVFYRRTYFSLNEKEIEKYISGVYNKL